MSVTVIPKRFVQSEKFQQFVKAEMLLFQSICGNYSNFTQAFANTQSAKQMDERKAQKNRAEFSLKSSWVMKPPLNFLYDFRLKEHLRNRFVW